MPQPETELMELVETLLAQELTCPVGIIRMVEETPPEIEYPYVGILDGGDNTNQGAGEGIDREIILVATYEEVTGEPRQSVLAAKAGVKQIRAILENPENYQNNGAIPGYQGAGYKGSSQGIPATMANSGKDIAVKVAKFEFIKHYTLM